MPVLERFDKPTLKPHSADMITAQQNKQREKFERVMALVRSGDHVGANQLLNRLRRLAPRDLNLLNLAAWLAAEAGDHPRAVSLYQQVLAQQPEQSAVRYNLLRSEAIIAEQGGDLPTALRLLQEAAALAPQDGQAAVQAALIARQLCDFSIPPPALPPILPPAAAMLLLDDPAAQQHNAVRWAQAQFGGITPLPAASRRTHHAPLRLGFLTSDLHDHATAYLIAELFELLDPSRHAAHIYSFGITSDAPVRRRIMAACPDFHDVRGLDARGVAERMRADGIDIAIDLKGYTRGGRLDILAYRPAPLQLHWLGFPGTLGCPFIDYFIADPVVLPPALRPHFNEKIIHLPDCYQINDRHRAVPPPLSRGDYGLPTTGIVFASFNQPYKLTPALLTLWADILQAVKGSVLWLLASNPTAENNLRGFFAAKGVTDQQLYFAAPTTQQDHLQRYHAVDIALDTFPIGGHTTTSDALWLGVPVVTLAGDNFVNRVAASLLTAAGLPELIAHDSAHYKQQAVALAQDHAYRAALKNQLVTQRVSLPLFDSPKFVAHFSAGIDYIWQRYNAGMPPEDYSVPRKM